MSSLLLNSRINLKLYPNLIEILFLASIILSFSDTYIVIQLQSKVLMKIWKSEQLDIFLSLFIWFVSSFLIFASCFLCSLIRSFLICCSLCLCPFIRSFLIFASFSHCLCLILSFESNSYASIKSFFSFKLKIIINFELTKLKSKRLLYC